MPRQTSGGGNRMTRLLDTIGGRVIALLLLLASVAMTGPVTTYVAAQRHDAALAELERIAESRPLIERLRAGIYQVVMESRGLYLAADRKQAETFARGQMAALGDIRATFDKLRQAVPDQHRDALAKAEAPLRAFIALRTELARVGVEQGREAADKLGNNAENRSTRTAFSNSLDGLANEVAATVDGLRTALADTGRNVAQQMLVFTLAAVLLVLMLALWMVRTTIGGPVRRVVGGITAMARGELDATDLPARARGEIGAIVAAAHQLRHLARCRRMLALVQQRADTLQPETIGRTVPAIPVAATQVEHCRRVAFNLSGADAALKIVRPVALGNMAAGAGNLATARQTLIKKQPRAKFNRIRIAGNPVGDILGWRRRHWPWPV